MKLSERMKATRFDLWINKVAQLEVENEAYKEIQADIIERAKKRTSEIETLKKREQRWSAALYDAFRFPNERDGEMFEDFEFDDVLGEAHLRDES